MGIERLARRHWVLIALALGLGAGYGHRSLQGPPSAPVGMGQREFESMLQIKPEDPNAPPIDDVAVVPVEDAYWVRAQRRYVSADGLRYEYRTEWLALKEKAYRPLFGVTVNDASYTVRDYLRDMAARYPHVHYRYAWEREPRNMLLLWVGGSLLLVGGIWPTVLGRLVGAGSGRGGQDALLDLDRFGGEGGQARRPGGITAEDEAKVTELDAQLEGALTADASPAATPPPAAPPAPAVSQLASAPLEALPPESKGDKEYGGEFYPTEAHAPPH